MSSTSTLRGGCACGAVRFECSSGPLFTFICHCRDCQRATGGPFAANVIFPATAVEFTRGEPATHVVAARTGQSSRHEFCAACGSPIGMRSDAFPEIKAFRAGSFDDPSGFQPTANVWMCNALPWDNPDPALPQAAENVSHEQIEAFIARSG